MRGNRTVVAVAAVLLVARAAAAQGTDSADTPAGTLTFGPLRIVPSLILKNFGVDENVFNDAENPKHDITFTLTPRADVLFTPGRFRVTYTTATDYVFYKKYTSERGTNEASSGKVEVDLGFLRPWVSASGLSTRERPNPEIDARARHQDVTYATGATLRFASRTSLSLSARRLRTTYDEEATFRGEDLSDALNGRTDTLEGGLGLELTPFTSLSLVVGHDHQRFDVLSERDSQSWRVMPTLTFNPGGILSGTFGIGYRRLTPVSAALAPYSGLGMQGDVAATFGTRYRATLGVTRDIRYSYERDEPYYLLTGVTGTLQTQLTSGWDVLGVAGRHLLDYRRLGSTADAGTDRDRTFGVGVGFRPKPRLRLGVQAEWGRRFSPRDALRNYSNRRVFTTIAWGVVP